MVECGGEVAKDTGDGIMAAFGSAGSLIATRPSATSTSPSRPPTDSRCANSNATPRHSSLRLGSGSARYNSDQRGFGEGGGLFGFESLAGCDQIFDDAFVEGSEKLSM